MRFFNSRQIVRRRIAVCLAALMLFLSAYGAMAADEPTASHYRLTEMQLGTVAGDVRVNVREEPDQDSDRLGRLEPGESCTVTGEEENWWQIEYGGKTGYVLKKLLEVRTVFEDVAVIVEDPLEASLAGLAPPTILKYRNEYRVSGVITGNIPLIGVTVEIWNLRTLSVERSAEKSFSREDDVREYDLKKLSDDISFRKLKPGEKKLIVRVESANDSMNVCEAFFYVLADEGGYAEPVSMTGDCDVDVDGGRARDLTDGDYATGCTFESAEDALVVTLPEGREAALLTLHWNQAPTNATLEITDPAGGVLKTVSESNPGGMLHFSYELPDSAAAVRVTTTDSGNGLCEVRVYEAEGTPDVVQTWQPLPDKADLLVVAAHPGDETLFFGGTIPYYIAQGKKVVVVYMADSGRIRTAEALEALHSCGMTVHPVFLGLKDSDTGDYDEAAELWGYETAESALIDVIRRCRPNVVVTHDPDGEYGHNQHKLTCDLTRSAVSRAGDAAVSADSAAKYGTWTPEKLYLHLHDENQLLMKDYDEPLEALGGLTAAETARIAFSKHVSLQDDFSMEKDGERYDNRLFGLAFTTVGEDESAADLFENID